MKKSNLWAGWAAMYSICLTFSFIPNPQGVLSGFMLILGLLFFLPPAMLLYWAIPRREFEMIRRIRTKSRLPSPGSLSAISLPPAVLRSAATIPTISVVAFWQAQ